MTNYRRILLGLGAGASLALMGCANEALPEDDAGSDASTTMDATMDAPPPPKDAGKDTAQPPVDSGFDAGEQDAGSDAATDASTLDGGGDAGDGGLPPVGSACNTPNVIQDQACGLCGKQYRACLAGGDGGYVWGAWGFCQGEVQGGCDPNVQYPDNDCGLCGKRKAVCLSNCTFDLAQQCTEPMNACPPGVTTFQSGLSCDAGGREQTCDSSCQFGNLSACLGAPSAPSPISIPAVGKVASRRVDLTGALKRLTTGSCPATSFSSSLTPYAYLRVDNPTNQTAKVSLWHSQALGGKYIDTVLTAYAGATPPGDADDNARKACLVTANDTCSDSNSTSAPKPCVSSWAGMMAVQSNNVTIPPNSSITVYNAAWSAGATYEGPIYLSVRTDSLQ